MILDISDRKLVKSIENLNEGKDNKFSGILNFVYEDMNKHLVIIKTTKFYIKSIKYIPKTPDNINKIKKIK